MRNVWKNIVVCLLIAVIFVMPISAVKSETSGRTGSDCAQNINFVSGEFIVKLKDQQIHCTCLADLNEKYQVKSMEKVFNDAENNILEHIYLYTVSDSYDILSVVEDYFSCPNVVYAEPNYILRNSIKIESSGLNENKIHSSNIENFPNDPDFNNQWSLHNTGQTGGTIDADIDAPEAWDIEIGKGDIVVAIPDSGIDLTHPDLDQVIWINEDEIPDNDIDDDNNGYIDDVSGWDFAYGDNEPDDMVGHGTLIAGIIAAEANNGIGIAGICWNCKIMPIKMMNSNFYRTLKDTALAITYAADNGADIISMSFGRYSNSQLQEDAVNYAYEKGCIQIGAVGNDNIDQPMDYPPAYSCVIAVSGTNEKDERCGESDWGEGLGSNYGDLIDVAAPGNDIYSTMPTYPVLFTEEYGKSNNYDYVDGNSFVAPHVAGLAALLLSQDPTLTNDEVRNIIRANVDPYDSEEYIGTGRINAYKALIRSNGQPDVPVTPAGKLEGRTGRQYTYSTSASDPDSDQLYYVWDWGDGNYSEPLGPYDSGEPVNVQYSWGHDGNYSVKVKAMDMKGGESYWSDPVIVSMPKNKILNISPLIMQFLENHQHLFPILRQILLFFV